MVTGKALQPVQLTSRIKRLGVKLDGGPGAVYSGAAAGILFGVLRVRRAIGAQKKFWVAAGGCFDQRLSMQLAASLS